jgi:transposase
VIDVSFDEKGVIVTLRLPKRRRRVCSVCGQTGRHLEIVDYRTKRWRHLDLGVNRCMLECELRRLRCPDCGVRCEAVRWARPGSPYTRDFEDVVAFLAQQMAKTPIRRLMRIAWDSVGDIVTRVVTDHLTEARFYGLVLIGVDEISYRRGQRYLTCVADHNSGRVVWAKPGRDAKTLQAFFELLGNRRHTIKAISIDMSAGYENAVKAVAETDEQFRPQIVFDPFHVCQLASRAVDDVRRAECNEHGKSKTAGGRWIKHSRRSLLKAPERQTEQQLARLGADAGCCHRWRRDEHEPDHRVVVGLPTIRRQPNRFDDVRFVSDPVPDGFPRAWSGNTLVHSTNCRVAGWWSRSATRTRCVLR